ncbi:uncharacterized protein [Parasteatoda tepidariorum]|uniref:uncharacterized protein n=1 Tax=Parasteatoda tepidariorum TaxID=114398 RepID=UPI00077FDF94|nr:uncharacterized protein LOC107448811 isoform X2 [Parasteatoda tepidariorum]
MSLKRKVMRDIIQKMKDPVVVTKRIVKRKNIDKLDKTYCCVPQCKTYGFKNADVSFHCFPSETSDPLRRKKWILALRIGKPVTTGMRVCSRHFRTTDYMYPEVSTWRPCLKKDSVPSLNLPVDNPPPKPRKKVTLPKSKESEEPAEKPVHFIKVKPVKNADDIKEEPKEYVDDDDDPFALQIITSDEESSDGLSESKKMKLT